ncbi:MAG: HAMP domain-containing protein, partial [Sneathiella sp.]
MSLLLSIKGRISAGFLILLVFVGLIGISSFIAFDRTIDKTSDFAKAASNVENILILTRDMTSLKDAANRYVWQGRKNVLTEFQMIETRMQASFLLVIEKSRNEEEAIRIGKLKDLFDGFSTNFSEAVALRAKRDTAISEGIDKIGTQARENLVFVLKTALEEKKYELAARAGQSLSALLMAQSDAARFLADPQPKLLVVVHDEIKNFREVITLMMRKIKTAKLKKPGRVTRKLAKSYDASFAEVVETNIAYLDLVDNVMSKQAEEFARVSSDLQQQATLYGEQIEAETIDVASSSQKTVGLIILVAVIVGSGLAIVTIRSISKPITVITQAMERLAHGNMDTEVPGLKRRDEIGKMAQSVEIFKTNAIERLKLEEDSKQEIKDRQTRDNKLVEEETTRQNQYREMAETDAQRKQEQANKLNSHIQNFDREIG